MDKSAQDSFMGIKTVQVKQSHLEEIGNIIKSLAEQADATEALRITVPVTVVRRLLTLYHTI
jgi:hypothetical protein